MADTTKDLEYLRFFHTSQEALKDKDILKTKAFESYEQKVNVLFAWPAVFQVAQISQLNRPSRLQYYKFFRNMKIFTFFGSFAMVMHEKMLLEKKWRYFDRFYPEATQLQRTLIAEAEVIRDLDARGLLKERSIEDKSYIDPDTEKIYESMYQLPPQRFPDAE